MERSRKFADAKRTEGRLKARHEIRGLDAKLLALQKCLAGLSSDRTEKDVYAHTLDALNNALGFDHADLTVAEDGWLRTKAHSGLASDYPDMKLDGPGIIVKAANQKKALLVPDSRKDVSYVRGEEGMLSELAVPIVLNERTVGVLNVESTRLGAFSPEDAQLLETLAGQVSSCLGRLRAEQSLRRSDTKVRGILDALPGLVFELDPRGVFLDYYAAIQSELAYPPETFIGRSVRNVLPAGLADLMESAMETSRKTGTVNVFEYQLPTMKRAIAEWEAHVSPTGTGGFVVVIYNVTERKKAEERLRESEARHRSLVDGMLDGTYRSTHDGRFVDVNPAFVRMFGYSSKEELLSIRDVGRALYFAPGDRASLFLDTGQERVEVFRMKRKDGSEIWVEDHGHYVHDVHGEVIFHEGVLRDVTERVRAEEALRESEKRYRNLFDGMLDGTYRSTHDGRFVDVNPAFVRMFGYSSKQEMLDIPNISKVLYFSPEERGSHILDTGKQEVEVYLMRRKDGSGIWVEDHGRYIHDDKGNVVFHEGVLRNVTERVQAEEALRESEKRYRDLVEMSPDAVVVHDGEKLVFINPSAAKIMGVADPRNVIGMEMTRFVHPDSRKAVIEKAKEPSKSERSPLLEEKFLRMDGSIVDVEVAAMPVLWHGKPAIQMAFRDITERKQMADELKSYSEHLEELVEERTAKLREAERMAAMGQMAATVAHDLRNPLTGIAGAAYYLRKKYGSTTDERTKEMLEVIEKDVEYSSRMMTGLVEYSGELRLDLAACDLRTITEKALEFVRIPDKVRVSNLTRSLPKANLDVEKITRVAVNLLQNAIEAMPLGGAVIIRSQKLDGTLRFSVSDTGVGIKEEAMSRIWVPFSTTKAKGMGLGLPMAKHIVEAHGGSISVESTYGKGTTVTVTLPINAKGRERGSP